MKVIKISRRKFLIAACATICSLVGVKNILTLKEKEELKEIQNILMKQWLKLAYRIKNKFKTMIYVEENIKDNVEELFSELNIHNYKLVGWGTFFEARVEIADVPKEIQKYAALKDVGKFLQTFKKELVYNSQFKKTLTTLHSYRFLKGELSTYVPIFTIPMLNNKNDIVPPSELIKTKKGNCEDFAILIACAFDGTLNEIDKNKFKLIDVNEFIYNKCFIVDIFNHSMAGITVFTDSIKDPSSLKDSIINKFTLILGSSEYVPTKLIGDIKIKKDSSVEEIIKKVNHKVLMKDIVSIVSRDNIFYNKDLIIEKYKHNLNNHLMKDFKAAKYAIDFLNLNITDEELLNLRKEYEDFVKNLTFKVLDKMLKNNKDYYNKIQEILNDDNQIKKAKEFFSV